MHAIKLLALGLATASALDPYTLQERQSTICGTAGAKLIELPSKVTTAKQYQNPLACFDLCKKTSDCKSMAVGGKVCWLFKQGASNRFKANARSPYIFWDASCDMGAPVVFAKRPPLTEPTTYVGPPVVTPVPVAEPLPENSIPLDTSNWSPPDNLQQFFDSYVSSPETKLEPPISDGTAPNVEGLGVPKEGLPPLPSCLVDLSNNAAQFLLAGSDYTPVLLSGTNTIAALASPTSEAHARTMGWPGEPKYAKFNFRKVAGTADIYDIVLASSPPKFVGKRGNAVALVDTSTGVGGRGAVTTSIFKVNCEGRLSVIQGGQPFAFDASSANGLVFTAGASKKSMMVIDSASQQTTKRTRGTSMNPLTRLHRRNLQRRSKYTDGEAPRCDRSPERLIAKSKENVPNNKRIAEQLGCAAIEGLSEAAFGDYFVPPPNMDDCCADHAFCYGNCEDGVYEQCNNELKTCMVESCQIFDKWWLYPIYGYCKLSSMVYTRAITSVQGRLYWWAQSERYCKCQCPDKSNLCPKQGGGNDCKFLLSTDKTNCGACGRTCGDNSRCLGGQCTCLKDRCGDTCLDFSNNANNCGSCGNKCDNGDGYCYKGKCVDPPACTAGFANGNFNGPANSEPDSWTTSTDWGNGETEQGRPVIGTVGTGNDIALYSILPKGQGRYTNTFETEVELCPGKTYAMTWARWRNFGTDKCTLNGVYGDGRLLLTEDVPGTGYAGFRNGKEGAGPHPVTKFFKPGTRVRKNGNSLFVPFKFTFSCDGNFANGDGASLSVTRFGDFKLTPCESECQAGWEGNIHSKALCETCRKAEDLSRQFNGA